MKTYILSTLDRIKKYSKTLDAKAILYNKNWEVFNETGEKEVLIFRPKNELLIVRQGIVQRGKWELLPTGSLLIETDATTYLFNAAFVDNEFLAMQLDGTDECMLMIEGNYKLNMLLDSLGKIESFLEQTYVHEENILVGEEAEETEVDTNAMLLIVVLGILIMIAVLSVLL